MTYTAANFVFHTVGVKRTELGISLIGMDRDRDDGDMTRRYRRRGRSLRIHGCKS